VNSAQAGRSKGDPITGDFFEVPRMLVIVYRLRKLSQRLFVEIDENRGLEIISVRFVLTSGDVKKID
jgi:hypothetical protein